MFNLVHVFLVFSPADLSVSLDFGKAVEDILSQSKLLMKTMGEWELLDMTADKISLVSYESTWDELVYYVGHFLIFLFSKRY